MKNKKTIQISILVLILVFFIYYILTHLNDFKQLSIINPLYLIPLIVLSLIISVSNGLIIKYTTEPFNIKMKFKEWFGLSIVTTFYNTITPFKGGLVAKATYLKDKHKLTYTNYLATVYGMYVINFFIGSLLGLITLFLLYKQYQIFNLIIFLVFLGFFIPLLLIILFSPKFKETKYNVINKFVRVMNGWNLIRKNKKIVFYTLFTIIIQLFLSAIGLILSYHIFGIKITLLQSLFLTSISSLALLIAITPGSLGIAETVSVFSALIIGLTPIQSLPVAILGRVVSYLIIFTLGPIYTYKLLKRGDKNES